MVTELEAVASGETEKPGFSGGSALLLRSTPAALLTLPTPIRVIVSHRFSEAYMSDSTGQVINLFHHGWPKLKTMGELVGVASATPKSAIMAKLVHHSREIERLHQAGHNGPAMLRQLIVVGVLVSRAVFEVYGARKAMGWRIEAPAESCGLF